VRNRVYLLACLSRRAPAELAGFNGVSLASAPFSCAFERRESDMRIETILRD
jgi:hypothetical protein